jgi:hypothetical protein
MQAEAPLYNVFWQKPTTIITKHVSQKPPPHSQLIANIPKYKITVDFSQLLKGKSESVIKQLLSKIFRAYISGFEPTFAKKRLITPKRLRQYNKNRLLSPATWKSGMIDISTGLQHHLTKKDIDNCVLPPPLVQLVLSFTVNRKSQINKDIKSLALKQAIRSFVPHFVFTHFLPRIVHSFYYGSNPDNYSRLRCSHYHSRNLPAALTVLCLY